MRKHKYIEDYEEFLEIIRNISRESEYGSPIIVEGEKDLQALRAVGVKGTIIVYKSREELLHMIDSIKPIRVILLLDLDCEGIKKTLYLMKLLEGFVKNVTKV